MEKQGSPVVGDPEWLMDVLGLRPAPTGNSELDQRLHRNALQKVYRMAREDQVPSIRIGRNVRFPIEQTLRVLSGEGDTRS